jgi:hypothetical protein
MPHNRSWNTLILIRKASIGFMESKKLFPELPYSLWVSDKNRPYVIQQLKYSLLCPCFVLRLAFSILTTIPEGIFIGWSQVFTISSVNKRVKTDNSERSLGITFSFYGKNLIGEIYQTGLFNRTSVSQNNRRLWIRKHIAYLKNIFTVINDGFRNGLGDYQAVENVRKSFSGRLFWRYNSNTALVFVGKIKWTPNNESWREKKQGSSAYWSYV